MALGLAPVNAKIWCQVPDATTDFTEVGAEAAAAVPLNLGLGSAVGYQPHPGNQVSGTLQTGSTLQAVLWYKGRMIDIGTPGLQGPNSETFGDRGLPKFSYLPFGAGPRVCVGASLALTESGPHSW